MRFLSQIQVEQGGSCGLISKQGKFTQFYGFYMLRDLFELKEFNPRIFQLKISELLGVSADRHLTDASGLNLAGEFSFCKADRKSLISRSPEFGQPTGDRH